MSYKYTSRIGFQIMLGAQGITLLAALFSSVCCNNLNVSLDVNEIPIVPIESIIESKSLPTTAEGNVNEGK